MWIEDYMRNAGSFRSMSGFYNLNKLVLLEQAGVNRTNLSFRTPSFLLNLFANIVRPKRLGNWRAHNIMRKPHSIFIVCLRWIWIFSISELFIEEKYTHDLQVCSVGHYPHYIPQIARPLVLLGCEEMARKQRLFIKGICGFPFLCVSVCLTRISKRWKLILGPFKPLC